jgi:TRASH domain-containing protein
MTAKTCAACDCELDANPIKVKVGGNAVEVCCESCARTLKEADASAAGRKLGGKH